MQVQVKRQVLLNIPPFRRGQGQILDQDVLETKTIASSMLVQSQFNKPNLLKASHLITMVYACNVNVQENNWNKTSPLYL